ncbi:MAG TPA: glycosyltransferase family 9 protein [Candidatus Eisenbacteria bacterium]
MPRGPAVVVRFSSLGDVLLAAHVPRFLREVEPGRRVLFATKERYASVLRGHPDIDRFYALEDRSSDPAAPAPIGVRASLGDLAAFLKREGVEEIFDLHQNFRSSRLTAGLERARRVLPPKHALRRRMMVYAKWLHVNPLPPLLRVYREISGLDPAGEPAAWLRDAFTPSELERAAARLGGDAGRFALLGVGARWATKRWPPSHYVALADRLERTAGLAPRFAVAPGESALAAEYRALLPRERHDAIAALEFREMAALASFARLIVSNDSAVLHLGPALGVPAVGLFGSTVPAFGFAPQGPRDRVAEIALACRPCDVHGKRRCPLRHHRCMNDLTPDLALHAALEALGREGA